jgi:hypothetical protein
VWGKQGFLHRGLIIQPVKPMVSFLKSVEDTGSAASHIMDSNGCSGIVKSTFESLGVYQGE